MKYSRTALLGLAAVGNAQILAPSVCPTGPVIIPTAIVYPVYISTYIAANTVFNINGGANITINNAPTNLQTTVTATSTVFSTVTTTVTGGAAPTATTVNQQIILAVNAPGAKHRRQNAYSGFLGAGGNIVPTCGQASPLNLINGQLFTASGGQFSTNTGIQSAPFAASASVGSITTLFGSNGNFVWLNQAFTGGAVTFCLAPNGQAIAGFTSTPAGCAPFTFKPLLASSCPGGVNSTSSATGSATSSASSSASGSATSSSSSSASVTGSSSSVSSSSISSSSSRSSSVSSSSASSSAPVVSPTGAPPAGGQMATLSFPAPAGMKNKRQGAIQYVTNSGTYTSDSTQAATFTFVNGQLYSGNTPFSTSPTTQSMIFTAVQPAGSITATFSLTGGFSWNNALFTINSNGNAAFGVLSGTLYVGFKSLPPGVQAVVLTANPVGTTPTSSSSSPTSTPSGNSTVKKRFNAYHLQAQHLQAV